MTQVTKFKPAYIWREDTPLGIACKAYNKEHSCIENWGEGTSTKTRHINSMTKALLALGFSEQDLGEAYDTPN
jgi:Holliday junction resolvasome RuvABC DNA-binding subunit